MTTVIIIYLMTIIIGAALMDVMNFQIIYFVDVQNHHYHKLMNFQENIVLWDAPIRQIHFLMKTI